MPPPVGLPLVDEKIIVLANVRDAQLLFARSQDGKALISNAIYEYRSSLRGGNNLPRDFFLHLIGAAQCSHLRRFPRVESARARPKPTRMGRLLEGRSHQHRRDLFPANQVELRFCNDWAASGGHRRAWLCCVTGGALAWADSCQSRRCRRPVTLNTTSGRTLFGLTLGRVVWR